MLVETPGAAGSTCSLANSKGTWQIEVTPGAAAIVRSPEPLYVRCTKYGFLEATITVEPLARGMPWQNVVSGGFFGQRAKDASDTAYEYPALVSVHLKGDASAAIDPLPAPGPKKISIEVPEPVPPKISHKASQTSRPVPDILAPPAISNPRFPAIKSPSSRANSGARFVPDRQTGVVKSEAVETPRAMTTAAASNLVGLRIGKHDRFVRVVLDFDRNTHYSSGFDREGRVIVRLPSTNSTPEVRRLGKEYAPITMVTVAASSDGNGSTIAIKTQGPISNKAFDLEPDEIGGHRIIIDLTPMPSPDN